MKKFQFKFNTVLQQRKIREVESLRVLGAAQQAYQQELREKARLRESLDSSLLRREHLGKDPTLPGAFQLENDFISGTRQRMVRQDQAIIRATRAVEKCLRAYLQARRQTRMLESLYERHYLEWKRERNRKEQREQDDLTVMRAHLAEMPELSDLSDLKAELHHA